MSAVGVAQTLIQSVLDGGALSNEDLPEHCGSDANFIKIIHQDTYSRAYIYIFVFVVNSVRSIGVLFCWG